MLKILTLSCLTCLRLEYMAYFFYLETLMWILDFWNEVHLGLYISLISLFSLCFSPPPVPSTGDWKMKRQKKNKIKCIVEKPGKM